MSPKNDPAPEKRKSASRKPAKTIKLMLRQLSNSKCNPENQFSEIRGKQCLDQIFERLNNRIRSEESRHRENVAENRFDANASDLRRRFCDRH
jgi:hypothetical protein